MTTIEKVIDYVITTPRNSNPSILRSLLMDLIEDTVPPGPQPGDTIIYDGGIVRE